MEIISTNIGQRKTVTLNGKRYETGIFKYSVNHHLQLGKLDVHGDNVIDRKYHGGIDKACYLYSEDHYPYWKNNYPELDWKHGMFGENLTVKNSNEKKIYIGDTYEVGSSIIQVSQPRQPCFKLGIRFKNQSITKKFIDYGYSGVYFRVIKEGSVRKGDKFSLIKRSENKISVFEVFDILYKKDINKYQVEKALNDPFLSEDCKNNISKIY